MEPVPETERMDGFKASPTPTLRLKDSSLHLHQKYDSASEKPFTPRRTRDSSISSTSSPSLDPSAASHYTPEPSSPYQERLRSRFVRKPPFPPPMSRTQSMPSYYSTDHDQLSPLHQSVSPRSSGGRVRFPRKPVDEAFVGLSNRPCRSFSGSSNAVLEQDESSPTHDGNNFSNMKTNSSFSRSRRPVSPRLMLQQTPPNSTPSSYQSISSSPSSYSSRLGDQYISGTNYCYSGSLSYPGSFSSYSIPSTPTSARSRSSSISSLETIPDSPDAEEAAIEADRISCAKAEAEVRESSEETKTKISRDFGGRGKLFGTGFGRDQRKRWSVCGAERRGDLNLDTIWEDRD